MKFIAKLIGPVSHKIEKSNLTFAILCVLLFVGFVGTLFTIGLYMSNKESSGWTKTQITVLRTNLQITHVHSSKAFSQIKIEATNEKQVVVLPKKFRVGQSLIVWVRRNEIAFRDPTGLRDVLGAMIEIGILFGVLLVALFAWSVSKFSNLYNREFQKKAYRSAELEDNNRSVNGFTEHNCAIYG